MSVGADGSRPGEDVSVFVRSKVLGEVHDGCAGDRGIGFFSGFDIGSQIEGEVVLQESLREFQLRRVVGLIIGVDVDRAQRTENQPSG